MSTSSAAPDMMDLWCIWLSVIYLFVFFSFSLSLSFFIIIKPIYHNTFFF
jgi:hypothetical protein